MDLHRGMIPSGRSAMYSKSLLSTIKWHEFRLFGGISEWPERVYGRDHADQYQRRFTRSPLSESYESSSRNFANEATDLTSYTIRISEDGKQIDIVDESRR